MIRGFPEEINRKIVDHISDVNITYSDAARDNLLHEGLHPEFVIKLGSPMKEVIDYYSSSTDEGPVLDRLGVTKDEYFIFSAHRAENVDTDQGLMNIIETLDQVSRRWKKK